MKIKKESLTQDEKYMASMGWDLSPEEQREHQEYMALLLEIMRERRKSTLNNSTTNQ